MKLSTIISENDDEEIRIICKERSEKIIFIEDLIKNVIGHNDTLFLTIGDTQYLIPSKEVLFFESCDGRIACHTKDKIYYSTYKLYELESILPPFFCRASKSSLVNVKEIFSIKKNLAGASEIAFRNTVKKTYLSRNYYKDLINKINETRLNK